MVLGKTDQRIVVNGRRHAVTLETSLCPKCGQSMVSGKEIERAENEIRTGRGEYSGQFRLRVNPELHRRLAELAADRNTSLNQLIQELLERGIKDAA